MLPSMNQHERDYLMALHNPWNLRQVRVPGRFNLYTQVSTYHGTVNFSSNAAGFANPFFQPTSGYIGVLNDATHTETVAGASALLAQLTYPTASFYRLVNAGFRIRCVSSFSAEAGTIQTYASPINYGSAYDVYRDHPHQKLHAKGEVASVVYYPPDQTSLSFSNTRPLNHFNGYHLGALITGAPTLQYQIQYAVTVEYISSSNTDLVPARTAPIGSTDTPLAIASSHNPADSSSWTFAGLAKKGLGYAADLGGYMVGAAAAGIREGVADNSSFAYNANFRALPGGNRQLMIGY